MDVAHFRSLQAQALRLAVAPLGAGSLAIDALVERAVPIQQDPLDATGFPIHIFDAAFAFDKLLVLACPARFLWEEQRTLEALGAIAVSVLKPLGGMHGQANGASGSAIRQTSKRRGAVLVERDSSNAATMDHGLVDIPGIERRISGDVSGKKLQGSHGLDVEGDKIGDIAFVKGLGILGQHDIPVDRISAGGDARTIAEKTFLLFLDAAISLLLVAAFFDAESAIGIAFGNMGHIKGALHVDARVVLAHPGVDMGDIEGDDFP